MEEREDAERKEKQLSQIYVYFFNPKSVHRVYGWTSKTHCIVYPTPQIF